MRTATQTEIERPSVTMTDAEIVQRLTEIDQAIAADGKCWNPQFMWHTARELQASDIVGDPFIVALTLASMTRFPGRGCRTSHAQVARRATTLKKLFGLANEVGWPKLMAVMGVRIE